MISRDSNTNNSGIELGAGSGIEFGAGAGAGADNDIAENALTYKNTSTGSLSAEPKQQIERLPFRTRLAIAEIFLGIPLILVSNHFVFAESMYYAACALIMLIAVLPFLLVFKGRRPQARDLVVVFVLIAIAVLGRGATIMIPQFKPVVALVIISGVTLGAESGFAIGAYTAFISNYFYGQGTWTPYQMYAFGIIGFISGLLFYKGLIPRGRIALAIFGGLVTWIIYGLIMDTASAAMFSFPGQTNSLIELYKSGLPFNLLHALATVIFLLILGPFMISKLDRIRDKYGLVARDMVGRKQGANRRR